MSTPSQAAGQFASWSTESKQDEPAGVKLELGGYQDLQAKIAGAKGRVVVVDVWSTSCLPCMKEFPKLVELHQQLGSEVSCISLNVDYIGLKSKSPESYRERVLAFLEKQGAAFDNLLSTEADEEIREKLEISSIPAILIFDRQGKLAHRLGEGNTGQDGLTYEGDVIPRVKELLAGQ